MDAGYFDNYGISLLCGWLRECVSTPERAALFAKHVSRALIIQIRDNVEPLGVNPGSDPAGSSAQASADAGPAAWVGRALDGVITPPEACSPLAPRPCCFGMTPKSSR